MFKVNANAETQLVKLEVRESQAHCACVQREPDGNPWYHDILRYIKDQQYPELANDNDKRTLTAPSHRNLSGQRYSLQEK